MSKFKVGDKVRILDGSKIENYTGGWSVSDFMGSGMDKYIGEVHTVRSVDESWFDGEVAYCLEGVDFNWDERGLELATEQKIVITADGKITTAVLYDGKKRIKNAKAICSPADEFDFGIGAALALERLMGNPTEETHYYHNGARITTKPEELLNCRIRVIDGRDNCCGFESGKIYTIKDGKIFGGDVFGLPTTGKLKDLDDLKYYFAPDAEKNSLSHSGGLSHFSARGVEYKVLPDTLDWNKFAHGNLEVRVNKNTFDEFMKQCKAKKFAWADGEECNPWKDFESLSKFGQTFAMAIGAVPGKYIWINFNAEDDSLKWSYKHDEDVDEYEFI